MKFSQTVFSYSPSLVRFMSCMTTSIVARGIHAITLLCIMAHMPMEIVGLYSLSTSLISLSGVILPLGLRHFFIPCYLESADYRRERMLNLMHGSLMIVCILTLLCVSVCILIVPQHSLLITTCLLTSILFYMHDSLMQYWGITQNTFYLITSPLLVATTNAFITYLACKLSTAPLLLFIGGQSIGYFVGCYGGIKYYGEITGWRFLGRNCITSLKPFLIPGILHIPFIVRPFIFIACARGLLHIFASIVEVGMFAVLDMVHALFQFGVMQPLQQAYFPSAMRRIKENSTLSAYRGHEKIMWMLMLSIVIMTLGVMPLLAFGKTYIPIQFHEVLPYIPYAIFYQMCMMGASCMALIIQMQSNNNFLSSALVKALLVQLFVTSALFVLTPFLRVLLGMIAGASIFFLMIYRYAYLLIHKGIFNE